MDRVSRDQRTARRRLREALRWLRSNPGRAFPPPRVEIMLRAALAAAVAEIAASDALGLTRPRCIECFGVPLLLRCTSWQRVILTDPNTGVQITTGFGCL